MHRALPLVILWATVLIGSLSWGPGAFASPDPLRWSGKFELVPLYDKDHRPVIVDGHTYFAERNLITFRTDSGATAAVFPGATTDLASIPPLVWPLMPPDGPYAEAAAIHDACYKSRGSFTFHGRVGLTATYANGVVKVGPFMRADCDETLREAMVALGVPWWPRVPIWAAVRLFGGAGWGH